MAEKVRNLIETNKIVRRLIALVLSFCLLLAIVIVYLRNSLGWFASNKDVSGNGAQVKVTADNFPDMHAWRFELTQTLTGGDEDADSLIKTGTWVDALDNETTTAPKGILPVIENTVEQNVEKEKFTFRSLQLGTVDNLLSLSADNCFYIRFDITEEKLYQISLGYSLVEAGIHFYQTDGTEVGSETIPKGPFVDLFVVDYFVSTTAYDPSTDTAQSTTVFDAMELLCTNTSLENGADLLALPEQENAYYLYIRFSPDLEKCFEATDHIAQYMPCEITFDVTLTVEFN